MLRVDPIYGVPLVVETGQNLIRLIDDVATIILDEIRGFVNEFIPKMLKHIVAASLG